MNHILNVKVHLKTRSGNVDSVFKKVYIWHQDSYMNTLTNSEDPDEILCNATFHQCLEERSGSVVKCLTRDHGVKSSSLCGGTALHS